MEMCLLAYALIQYKVLASELLKFKDSVRETGHDQNWFATS